MVLIDIEMPDKCMNCPFLGKDMMYCCIYSRRDLDVITVASSKPDWCPLYLYECEEELNFVHPKKTISTQLKITQINDKRCSIG